jgi:hypothetical protein
MKSLTTCSMLVAAALVALTTLGCVARDTRPDWAGFFSPKEYADFLDVVRAYFESAGTEVEIRDGAVMILDPSPVWGQATLGLANVAQKCHQADRSQWERIVADHFELTQAAERETADLEENLHDFDAISHSLVVRLWPLDYREAVGAEEMVYRVDLDDVISVLAYDLPTALRSVARDETAQWGQSDEELFAIGLENVRRLSSPQPESFELEDGVEAILLTDESYFASTHALMLDEHAECLGTHGSLITVPSRDALVCYPIEDINVARAISGLIPIAQALYEEGPGSVSANLYWYDGEGYITIPYEITDAQVSVYPPDEFVEMLNQIAE